MMLLPCSLVKRIVRTYMLRVRENPNENTSRGMDRATPQTDSSQSPQNPQYMKKQKQKHFFPSMGDKKKSSSSSFFCCRCLYFFGCCLWQNKQTTKKTNSTTGSSLKINRIMYIFITAMDLMLMQPYAKIQLHLVFLSLYGLCFYNIISLLSNCTIIQQYKHLY